MKTKRVIKAVVFVLCFVLLLGAVSELFVMHTEPGYQNIRGFYKQKKNSLDAIYIGSSNCFTYWNSAVGWSEYGIAVYPYAANKLLFEGTEYIIRDCRKTQPDAKFIVNINTLMGETMEMDEIHYTTTSMPYSMNRLRLVSHLCRIGGFGFWESLEYYFPIIRFHGNYQELLPSRLLYKNDGFKGASTGEPYLRIVTDVSGVYSNSDAVSELPEHLTASVNSLLDYCDQSNVEVTFVTVPQARTEEDLMLYNGVNQLLESRGYPVLNLMEKTDDMGIDRTFDFYNTQHTNIHGSIKYTHYMARYLIETYGFTDKREDENYSDWNEMAPRYQAQVANRVLDIEYDITHRDFELAAPENLQLADGVLTWDASEGAEYYRVYKKTSAQNAWTLAADQLTQTEFVDEAYAETDIYTVVPVKLADGEAYYGSFLYTGIPVNENDIGSVEDEA